MGLRLPHRTVVYTPWRVKGHAQLIPRISSSLAERGEDGAGQVYGAGQTSRKSVFVATVGLPVYH